MVVNPFALVDENDLRRFNLLDAASATLYCNIADRIEATSARQLTIVQVAQWVDESSPDLTKSVGELADQLLVHLRTESFAI